MGDAPRDFEDQVALITGGSSGIGKATAMMFARRGAKVVISDLAEEAGQASLGKIRASGAEAIFVRTNVTDSADCEQMVRQTLTRFGKLDVAVNSAGTLGAFAPTAEYDPKEWQRVLDVNLTGVFNCLASEIRAMTASGGAIVNISSILGLVGGPGAPAYCAAKHGVIGLTKSAALECGRHNIRVNAVCPGFTDTGMVQGPSNVRVQERVKQIAIRRLANPDEVAELALWLCSRRASYVTGAAYTIDGGDTAG